MINGLNMDDKSDLCQQYLNILYQDIDKHIIYSRSKQNIFETYGEILYPSVDKIISHLSLTENDVFVDLGSGIGKVVTQFFLTSPVSHACGIEIIPELHQQALIVQQKIQHDLPEFYLPQRQLSFLLGNFLQIPLSMATVVLICSPCFGQSLLNQLADIINKTPSIHTALSLRPLAALERIPFKKTIRVECSWDAALCYLYSF